MQSAIPQSQCSGARCGAATTSEGITGPQALGCASGQHLAWEASRAAELVGRLVKVGRLLRCQGRDHAPWPHSWGQSLQAGPCVQAWGPLGEAAEGSRSLVPSRLWWDVAEVPWERTLVPAASVSSQLLGVGVASGSWGTRSQGGLAPHESARWDSWTPAPPAWRPGRVQRLSLRVTQNSWRDSTCSFWNSLRVSFSGDWGGPVGRLQTLL